MCGLWVHHKPCSTVSDEGFKFLSEQIQATGSAYWGCRSCISYAQGITKKVREVEKKLDEVQKEVKDNAKDIERVDKNVGELRKELDTIKKKDMADASKFITAEEYRERESRRANVIMHRVKEAEATTAEERRKADTEECCQIFQAAGWTTAGDEIVTCRRIGEKKDGPRPLTVVMTSESARAAALSAARRLKNTRYGEVSIIPDLTQQQRSEEAGLAEEAARRNRDELTEEDAQKNLSWQVVGQRGAKKIIKAYTRNYGQRGGGNQASRGRVPVVPQPRGPTLSGPELLPSRKRPREYRPRLGEASGASGTSGTSGTAEEMEEEDEEETRSPANKK
jgi:hypothetical protein